MTEKEFAIYTYEQLLSNNIKSFSPYFFIKQYRKERINVLLKYLFEEKLKLTPAEALDKISYELLRENRLDIIVSYIEKPDEFAENDYRYIVFYIYPGLDIPDNKTQAIQIYKEILANKRKKFPKNYFLGGHKGEERAIECFKYLCEKILKLSKEEILDVFSNSKGLCVLSQYKLKIVMNVLFSSFSELLNSAYPNIFSENNKEEVC